MARTKRTTQSSEPTFEPRVRFNFGYHDGVAAYTRPSPNFGFGPALTITLPGDVLKQHADRVYALGWIYGYNAACRGEAQQLSEEAWTKAVNYGEMDLYT